MVFVPPLAPTTGVAFNYFSRVARRLLCGLLLCGFDQRANQAGTGPVPGRWEAAGTPSLTPEQVEQVEQCRRMREQGAGLRHIARVMRCSPATVKKAPVAT